MNENLSSDPVRTVRGVVGVIAALMMTGLALTVVTGQVALKNSAPDAAVVLATNAGPATPPATP